MPIGPPPGWDDDMYSPFPDQPNIKCNDAAMAWLEQHYPLVDETAGLCEWALIYDNKRVPCAFGNAMHCTGKMWRDEQVWLMYSLFAAELEPVGQMSLFEPHITQRRVWVNAVTGERVDSAERPFRHIHPACKARASALVLMHSTAKGAAWRIVPILKRKGAKWLLQEQQRMAGKVKPCVFEEV